MGNKNKVRKVAMLGQHQRNCQWGCCPEYGHQVNGRTLRRMGRQKEDYQFQKEINKLQSKPSH